jgi:hypothetical protein
MQHQLFQFEQLNTLSVEHQSNDQLHSITTYKLVQPLASIARIKFVNGAYLLGNSSNKGWGLTANSIRAQLVRQNIKQWQGTRTPKIAQAID